VAKDAPTPPSTPEHDPTDSADEQNVPADGRYAPMKQIVDSTVLLSNGNISVYGPIQNISSKEYYPKPIEQPETNLAQMNNKRHWATAGKVTVGIATILATIATITTATLTFMPADSAKRDSSSSPGHSRSPHPSLLSTPTAISRISDRPRSAGSSPLSTPTAASTAPVGPDGVTYQCTGSAPSGIDITYGPSGSGFEATQLPFAAQDVVNASTSYYRINAQLKGSGDVTCVLTVIYAGRTTTNSGTARGGYNITSPQICGNYRGLWDPCG
jgi:hypothetical protein